MWITLNARLRPLDRGTRYEIPLQEVLDARAPGSRVTGGGTLLTTEREPLVSDIDLDVEGEAREVPGLVIAALEAAGAPKGSRARLDESDPVTFGVTEGVAIYLNGTDLPDEVYASGDVNDLIAALRLGRRGRHAIPLGRPARNGGLPVRLVRRADGRADRRRAGPVPARTALPGSPASPHTAVKKLTCQHGIFPKLDTQADRRSAA